MITGIILAILWILIEGLIAMLPTGAPLSETALSYAQTLGHYLASVNSFLPVSDLLTVLTLSAIVAVNLIIWRIIKWLLNVFRGAGA